MTKLLTPHGHHVQGIFPNLFPRVLLPEQQLRLVPPGEFRTHSELLTREAPEHTGVTGIRTALANLRSLPASLGAWLKDHPPEQPIPDEFLKTQHPLIGAATADISASPINAPIAVDRFQPRLVPVPSHPLFARPNRDFLVRVVPDNDHLAWVPVTTPRLVTSDVGIDPDYEDDGCQLTNYPEAGYDDGMTYSRLWLDPAPRWSRNLPLPRRRFG